MVFSYYLYKYPYKIIWHIKNKFGSTINLAFYCADPLDYEMFLPIAKYLPDFTVIASNSKTKKYLFEKGIHFVGMPAFPKVVIMARQTPYKFPVDRIIKFGFDHGLYQFKRWTSARNYNGFDVYFVSSAEQVKTANRRGISTVKAIGYPKLDNAFNGDYNREYLANLKKTHNIDANKKTIIFTTTWNVAGLSAINHWFDKLEELTPKYNILVTVHTWTEKIYIEKLNSTKGIVFIKGFDVTPYLMIADIFVGDYSSIIGEFCAFDKPIITFNVPESGRTIPDVIKMIKDISIQINRFDQLPEAVEHSLKFPNEKSDQRKRANKILFDTLDGKAGYRAAKIINDFLKKSV